MNNLKNGIKRADEEAKNGYNTVSNIGKNKFEKGLLSPIASISGTLSGAGGFIAGLTQSKRDEIKNRKIRVNRNGYPQ